MIPQMKLTIEYSDGARAEVAIRPRTQVAFEQKFNIALGDAFTEDGAVRFEHLYFLAWHAGRASQEFAVWLDLVEGIEVEVDGPVDPTPPILSDGS